MPENRVAWLDAARGIGILLVVFGHVERGLGPAGVGEWSAIDYTLYTFHMPLFFLLAGLNAPRGLAAGPGPYLWKKVPTIVYPYFLWSFIQTSAMIAAGAFTNGKAEWSELLVIGWEPVSPFWFLYALMLCHIVFALIGLRTRVLVAIGLAACLASQAFAINTLVERFLFSLPFFVAGALIATRSVAPARPPSAWLAAALWLAFALAVLGARVLLDADDSSLATLPAAALGIAATLETARSLPARLTAPFAALGLASMSIYVMHIIAGAGARAILLKLHVPPIPWAYAAICTVVGVGAPFVAHMILWRLGALHYFGLAAPPRRATMTAEAQVA